MQVLHVEKNNPNNKFSLFKILILAIFITGLFTAQNLTATNYFNSTHISNNFIKLNDSIVIRGRIIDSTGNSIADAVVFVFKRRLGGVITDNNGEFRIKAKENDDSIVVARIGYITTVFGIKPLKSYYLLRLSINKGDSSPSQIIEHSLHKKRKV